MARPMFCGLTSRLHGSLQPRGRLCTRPAARPAAGAANQKGAAPLRPLAFRPGSSWRGHTISRPVQSLTGPLSGSRSMQARGPSERRAFRGFTGGVPAGGVTCCDNQAKSARWFERMMVIFLSLTSSERWEYFRVNKRLYGPACPMPAVQRIGRCLALTPSEQALRTDQCHHHHQPQLQRMVAAQAPWKAEGRW